MTLIGFGKKGIIRYFQAGKDGEKGGSDGACLLERPLPARDVCCPKQTTELSLDNR
jgi:hypothetical protein